MCFVKGGGRKVIDLTDWKAGKKNPASGEDSYQKKISRRKNGGNKKRKPS
jgi:hypothetical protein